MKFYYQKPEAELGVFAPGFSLLEDSGAVNGDISDLDLINDSWDY